jgi:tRNA(Met) C34 N-acetyltransferase TmcA
MNPRDWTPGRLRRLVGVIGGGGWVILMSAPRPPTTSSAPQGGLSKVAEPHLLKSQAMAQRL